MALFRRYDAEDSSWTLAVWQVTEDEEALVHAIPAGGKLLAEARERFTAPSRRIEWLAVRRLLHELGISPASVAYHPSGRPYLKGSSRYFSISHTCGYVAVFLHDKIPVGVDIEQRSDKVFRVRSRYVSADEEREILYPLADDRFRQQEALLVLWSFKEAMYKVIDCEGVDFLTELSVRFGESATGDELWATGCYNGLQNADSSLVTFSLRAFFFPDFVLTWAVLS